MTNKLLRTDRLPRFFKMNKVRLNRSFSGNTAIVLLLIIVGAFMFLPMVFAISSSLKPLSEIWYFPPRFFVQNPTLRNFRELFRVMTDTSVPFLRYVFNTVLIAVVGTGGHVIVSSMCAFPLAKHNFPGRTIMFYTVVLALMFNATVTAIPAFIVISKLHMIDTYFAYIIPAMGAPLGLYLMKQFVEQMIPDTVLESAKIDGAGDWTTLWIIVMPMVKPAWLTLIIFSFQSLWAVGSTNYIFNEQLKTINNAISQILAGGIARAGVGAAVSVVMMVVPVTVFLVSQSNVVETMSTSGMKG